MKASNSATTCTRPQFIATRQWNHIVTSFEQNIPVKSRVRYHLRTYGNCFTAAQAVSWLKKFFRESGIYGEVTTAQIEKFCQKLVDQGVIYDATKGKRSRRHFSGGQCLFCSGPVPYRLNKPPERETKRNASFYRDLPASVATPPLSPAVCHIRSHPSLTNATQSNPLPRGSITVEEEGKDNINLSHRASKSLSDYSKDAEFSRDTTGPGFVSPGEVCYAIQPASPDRRRSSLLLTPTKKKSSQIDIPTRNDVESSCSLIHSPLASPKRLSPALSSPLRSPSLSPSLSPSPCVSADSHSISSHSRCPSPILGTAAHRHASPCDSCAASSGQPSGAVLPLWALSEVFSDSGRQHVAGSNVGSMRASAFPRKFSSQPSTGNGIGSQVTGYKSAPCSPQGSFKHHSNSFPQPLNACHRQLSRSTSPLQMSWPFTPPVTSPVIQAYENSVTDPDVWKEAVLSRLLRLVEIPTLEAIIHCVDMDGAYIAENCGQTLVGARNTTVPLSFYQAGRRKSWPNLKRLDVPRPMFDCTWSDVHEKCPRSSTGVNISYTPLICSAMDYLAFYPQLPGQTCCQFWQGRGIEDVVPTIAQHFRRVVDKPIIPCAYHALFSATHELITGGKQQRAIEALQYCVLLLPRPRLVLLERMLTFFAACQKNKQLVLCSHHNNLRYLCLSIGPSVLQSKVSDDWPLEMEVEILSFMALNVPAIFKVPDGFVDEITAPVQEREISYDSGYNSMACSEPREDARTTEFCEDALLSLLDVIIAGDGMPKQQQQRRLKTFRQVHPNIFKKRFPNAESETADSFDERRHTLSWGRIRGTLRRGSRLGWLRRSSSMIFRGKSDTTKQEGNS